MKDILLIHVLLLAFAVIVNSQDDPKYNTPTVVGPDSFVTDGTKLLKLTCHSGTSSSVVYSWSLNKTQIVCGQVSTPNECYIRPLLQNDEDNVTCLVTNLDNDMLTRASYTLNLQYPAQTSPNISVDRAKTEPLQQGDNIMCTVSGGKPPVTNITFECQNPDHLGRQDDDRTVSTITVDTSQATADNMTCTCSAHWDPEPALYSTTTDREFVLEYKANVTHFTVNGNTITALAESSKVTFWCQGSGRPSPRLMLDKHGNDQTIASSTASGRGPLHTIQSARCEDLGNYTCEANNDFPNPNSETVQLFVTCVPRVSDDSFHPSKLCNVTQVGLTVTVVGYPTPDISVYSLGEDAAREDAFNKSCVRDNTMEHLVHCEVTPVNAVQGKCGVYDILIWNDYGNISLSAVQSQEHPSEGQEPLSVGYIVLIVVGVFVIIIGVVIVCFAVRKFKEVKRTKHCNGSHLEQYENTAMENIGASSSQRVAAVQPNLRGSQAPNTDYQPHSSQTPPSIAYDLDPGYACPADTIPRPTTAFGTNATKQANKAETKPTPLDPGYASADEIGMSTDAQRVAVSYNPNSLKSRSANQYCDIPLQPAEPANKPQDDGVDEYNVLGGQGATSGPDPTYSHINKVNKNQ